MMNAEQKACWQKAVIKTQRLVTARAISFEEKLQANQKLNTRDAEDEVQQALEALGRITRKYIRLLKRK